ncbi:MAG: hypothetical protein ACXAC7_10650 [Candidatus Hodarchaeales archaeon]|jgi:hypothetical protein
MNVISSSIFKGIFLAIMVIIAGIAVGSFFIPEELVNKPVDIQGWMNEKDTALPKAIFVNLKAPSYPYNLTLSEFKLPELFYDNISSFDVYYDKLAKNWIILTTSVDSIYVFNGSLVRTYTRDQNFTLSKERISSFAQKLKGTIRTIIPNSSTMTHQEYRDQRSLFYNEIAQNGIQPPITTYYYGMDDIVISLEFLPQGIFAYVGYYKVTYAPKSYGDQNYDDFYYVDFNFEITTYYLYTIRTSENFFFLGDYIPAWNATLKEFIK